jgi:ribosomal protein S18 acetylase RimI-like enzyme
MEITIESFDAHNRYALNRCDGAFMVESKLILYADQGNPTYTIVSVSPYIKRYPPSEISDDVIDAASLAALNKAIFFAYGDGELAGQIILSQSWNGYAYVEDIAVDNHFRQRGVGRALIHQAIAWAKARGMPGIMLETQNTNVAASLFYQRCGFELGGFDRYLYRALEPNSDEIALYWYLFFP